MVMLSEPLDDSWGHLHLCLYVSVSTVYSTPSQLVTIFADIQLQILTVFHLTFPSYFVSGSLSVIFYSI